MDRQLDFIEPVEREELASMPTCPPDLYQRHSFYRPRYRYELVAWFKENRPDWKISGWSKRKLYAVYIKEMRRD